MERHSASGSCHVLSVFFQSCFFRCSSLILLNLMQSIGSCPDPDPDFQLLISKRLCKMLRFIKRRWKSMEVWLNKNTSPTFWVVFGTSHLNQHCIYNEGISLAKIHRGKCISTKSPWFLATCWLFHRAYQRWREKGAGRTNRYSLMCAIQLVFS